MASFALVPAVAHATARLVVLTRFHAVSSQVQNDLRHHPGAPGAS